MINLENKRLVVALSGGIDSVALLHYYSKKHKVRAIHINHNQHPDNEKWQKFCSDLCSKLNINLKVFDVFVTTKNNLEHKMRSLRYKKLFSDLQENEVLLTAHHQQDQAETFLLNLLRGSSAAGLSAMPYYKKNHYRPFLNKDKQWIVNYVAHNKLDHITDDSNYNNRFRRNFIRNKVLPLVENHYPQIVKTLSKNALKQRDLLLLTDDLAKIDIENKNIVKHNLLFIPSLQNLARHRIINIIYYHIKSLNFRPPNSKVAQQIYHAIFMENTDTKLIISWKNYCVRKFNKHLYFINNDENHQYCPIYEKLKHHKKLVVKHRRGGEKIKFHNEKHSKYLKKVLQDKKIPPWLRLNTRMYYIEGILIAVEHIGFLVDYIKLLKK